MTELETFVKEARAKGLTDHQITEALTSQGWDTVSIKTALLGLTVPHAPAKKTEDTSIPVASDSTAIRHTSVHPLMSALHHILLWFFTGSSTITIVGVVASLTGNDVSSMALASMIAITLITFTPYATLYILYLIKMRKSPDATPGKVWSIITICLHSIGTMIAAITLVTAAITGGSDSVMISASLVLLLDGIVVTTYAFAAFGSVQLKIRRVITLGHLPLLLIMFAGLFAMSLFQLGPARHDEELRKSLVSTVEKIATYTKDNEALPLTSQEREVVTSSDITYRKKSRTTYEVCASFQTTHKDTADYDYAAYTSPNKDNYVSESDFYTSKTGRQCFGFESDDLSTADIDYPEPLEKSPRPKL